MRFLLRGDLPPLPPLDGMIPDGYPGGISDGGGNRDNPGYPYPPGEGGDGDGDVIALGYGDGGLVIDGDAGYGDVGGDGGDGENIPDGRRIDGDIGDNTDSTGPVDPGDMYSEAPEGNIASDINDEIPERSLFAGLRSDRSADPYLGEINSPIDDAYAALFAAEPADANPGSAFDARSDVPCFPPRTSALIRSYICCTVSVVVFWDGLPCPPTGDFSVPNVRVRVMRSALATSPAENCDSGVPLATAVILWASYVVIRS